MATKITDDAFRKLLSDISKWYDQREYTNMLKVLYRDLLKNNYELNKATKVMELMDMLTASGHLHSANLNVLYDTINITEQKGIKEILPVFQNVEGVKISKFTHHRQKVMKLGMVLIGEDVNKISALYNNPVKEYADTWSLIMDLERNRVICEGKMEAFIEELYSLKLQDAVEALTEEIAVKVIQKRRGESSDSKKYALDLLDDLDEHKDSLTLKDTPEFLKKFEKLIIYYKRWGLKLTNVGNGSIVFYLSTNDPNALMSLWKIHSSGKLIKDLAQILVPEEHQQEFIDEWMTSIDENKYKEVLCKLKGKGTTDDSFKQLLSVISEWYDQRGYINMLKVLYRDLLKDNYELNRAANVMNLMNLLIASGHLDSTYFNLLYDTINITEQYGLERRIKEILPEFQNVSDVEITEITYHRQKVMKLGMVLIDEDLKKISGLYKEPVKEYADTWSLIMDLEQKGVICERKMDAFIENLNTLKLQHAVEALTEGTTDDAFRQLLSVISEWYDQHGYINMLKVLYRDLLKNNYELNKATKVMDLMNLLIASGDLHSTHLSLLYDTINITKQYGLERKIQDVLPVYQIGKVVEISEFTHHRRKVMKLGMVLIDEDINKISALYNKPVKEYADTWSLIMDLEQKREIGEGKMDAFIEILDNLKLQYAVEALTEGTTVQVNLKQKEISTDSEDQPHLKKNMDALRYLKKLYEHRGTLTAEDIPEFAKTHEKLMEYYEKKGLNLTKYKQSGEYIGKVTLPRGMKVYRMYKMMNGNIVFSDYVHRKPVRICNMNGQVGSKAVCTCFDMNKNETIKEIGSLGTKGGQMRNVIDINLTKHGHHLVLESEYLGTGTSRLKLFDNEGRFTKILVESGDEDGKLTWTQINITQVQKDDNGDYFVTGKCTSPGVCKLDVSVDDEPIKQSPMIIIVEREGLINTIQINKECVEDVVKCEDDSLLVSCWTNEMLKYKQSGEYIGKVALPQGVEVSRMYKMKNGNIAFSDLNLQKPVRICNLDGQVINTIGKGVLRLSCGIHVDELSNVLYVAGGLTESCVYMFDMNMCQDHQKHGSQVTRESQMSHVIDVTLTNQGHLLVLEYGNSRLQLFDNEGRFMKVLVEAGNENGKMMYPYGVEVDQDDNIIISSEHKIQLFSSDGNFIKRIDKPEDGINNPKGLSIISYHPRRLAVVNYEIALKLIRKRKRESSDSEGQPHSKILKLNKFGKGSLVFYVSTNDPNALMSLWEIHSSGKLLKDLAKLLVPEEHQLEFIDEWMTYIDENEYKVVLSKLRGK
ncbi:uncharacterized protein LOC117116451, partial [Anneissia japonica]|uniref:uncharacterized protein LOC117116451 n=1 Tax=Anneissia japonica TaxID=1529436 RepID=UPI00142575BB